MKLFLHLAWHYKAVQKYDGRETKDNSCSKIGIGKKKFVNADRLSFSSGKVYGLKWTPGMRPS